MDTQNLIIPNYKEVILHIQSMLEFPTDFTLNILSSKNSYMSVTPSINVYRTAMKADIIYSEKLLVIQLNQIYRRFEVCIDRAMDNMQSFDFNEIIKIFQVLGIVHEFGHIHRTSLAFKHGAHRTFVASKLMNKQMFKAMEHESYVSFIDDYYDPSYLLNPEELYADGFAKDHFERVFNSLVENKLI